MRRFQLEQKQRFFAGNFPMMKKIILLFISLILLGFLTVLYTNISVYIFAKDKTFSAVENIPKNKVGLILGTSQYLKSGGLNPFFQYRIEAAVKLFNHQKIDFILVSGDNKHHSYNEPEAFKKVLIEKGIPKEKIVLDYAGFRTLDSVIRAQKVFGQNSFTVISQNFHNQRAIYIARKNDIEVIGFDAKDPTGKTNVYWREYFAKTKAYFDILWEKQPKFLGDPIIIE